MARNNPHRSTSGRSQSTSRYPRVARINEVLREIVAEELERRVDDDARLEMVTVTGIDTDSDLGHATVYFSALGTSASLDEVVVALEEHRRAMQSAVGRNVRMKRTPLLRFIPDPGVLQGQTIETLLRSVPEAVHQPHLEDDYIDPDAEDLDEEDDEFEDDSDDTETSVSDDAEPGLAPSGEETKSV